MGTMRNVADTPFLISDVLSETRNPEVKILFVLLLACAPLVSVYGKSADRMLYKGQLDFYIVNRTRVRESDFRHFTKISKSITDSYLKDFDVFAVSRNGYYGCVLMPQEGIPVYFDDLPDAATFLSDRIGKVGSKEEAEAIMRMLPALFSYEISAPTPENKQPYEMKQLDAGWQLTCHICGNPERQTHYLVTIAITRDGIMTVPEMKFTGTMAMTL